MIETQELPARLATREDIPEIRRILEHPEVRSSWPGLTIEGKPWEEAFDDILWYIFDGGVFIAEINERWEMRAHAAVLPEARGQKAIDAARFIIDTLFSQTPVSMIEGWTPTSNRAACAFNRALGFRACATDGDWTLFVRGKGVS